MLDLGLFKLYKIAYARLKITKLYFICFVIRAILAVRKNRQRENNNENMCVLEFR